MSNSGHYTLCPYYKDSKNKSITCEDIFRTFRWKSQRHKWMVKYCDCDWNECPYAQSLNEVYRKVLEEGADMEKEMLKQKCKELEKELKKVKTMLGKAEKRLEAKDDEIKDARRKKNKAEEHYKIVKRWYHEINEKYENEKLKALKFEKFIEENLIEYEKRYCFMLSKMPNQELIETEYTEWVKNNNARLKSIKDDKGNLVKVTIELIGNEAENETEK